jgi:F-type H+-transporting ATPase subunit b
LDSLGKLGINGGFLLAQILNFLIIFLVVALIAWRPLIRVLEARRERIAKGLEDARVAEQARANAERDAQKLIEERRIEADKLVEEGQRRGEEQARAVIEAANREAETIRVKALQEIEEKRTALLGEVRSQVVDLAIAAAQRVIGDTLVDKKHARAVIGDFFARAPAEAQGLGQSVEVTSALPLTDAEKSEIQERIGAQEVAYRVDPSILGGLILRAGEKVVDASVRTNLQALAVQMR